MPFEKKGHPRGPDLSPCPVPPPGRQGNEIDSYLWCAVGAVLGWCAGGFATMALSTLRIESVLVGIFGAFIGGEFVAAMVRGGPRPDGFNTMGLGLAALGALGMLALLGLMRRSVGPLRVRKSRSENRR